MRGPARIIALCLVIAPVATLPAQPPQPTGQARPARPQHAPGDPWEGFNRTMFRVFQKLDKAVLRPVALGYRHVVPRVVRSGIRNVFSNLGEPIVFVNDVLQLRPGRAMRTFGRFAINSTLGVGGLIDVATPEKLPHRPNGFGDTLGYYGVKPGPFIFVPVLGPSTLRDLIGGTGDGLVLPLAVGSPFDRTDYQVAKGVLTGLDQRAEADDELNALYRTALDPYATLRSAYLQTRASEIAGLKAKGRNLPGEAADLGDPMLDPDPMIDPAGAPESGQAPSPATPLDPLADPAAPPAPATDPANVQPPADVAPPQPEAPPSR
ncbi:VacJ family lipoprotein [Sphingomonas sp.]|uniref:MlaA family lipoprotein n=1 Tax=Sphingomonas sp. TaxID=28214 RepID=UPI000DB27A29|nr:VacJ family lipoprotein [Sphingomonas sp.]PZU06222.1 MAG: ABC transporter [Sphingomonas sp.]